MQGVLLKSMATEARIQEGLIQKHAEPFPPGCKIKVR